MPLFIKAKNGNVVAIEDGDLAVRAIKDGHEVVESELDPREKDAKPKKWVAPEDESE